MANIHAYKTVYALKEIAEDLLYFPEDIISDENSAEVILQDGFRMLLQAQCTEEEIRNIINVGYDVEKVDIFECKAEEFLQGFDFGDQSAGIDLESSVEDIESRAQADDANENEEKKPEKPKIAPGDFVIKSREPGKQKNWRKIKENQKKLPLSVLI